MDQDASSVIRVACDMLAKYQGEAVREAESRADEQEKEPIGAMRWRVVADTIRMLSDDPFLPPARPLGSH